MFLMMKKEEAWKLVNSRLKTLGINVETSTDLNKSSVQVIMRNEENSIIVENMDSSLVNNLLVRMDELEKRVARIQIEWSQKLEDMAKEQTEREAVWYSKLKEYLLARDREWNTKLEVILQKQNEEGDKLKEGEMLLRLEKSIENETNSNSIQDEGKGGEGEVKKRTKKWGKKK